MCYICKGPSCNACGQYDAGSPTMALRVCPSCGNTIRNIFARCPYCGTPREQESERRVDAPRQ